MGDHSKDHSCLSYALCHCCNDSYAGSEKHLKKPYYSYADVTIASVSTALGEQKLTGYSFSGSSSSAEANYQYRIDDGEDAAERYVQYLLHNEGASYVDGNPMILRKNGMDHKYDVTIKLVWNSKYLQVTLHYNKL